MIINDEFRFVFVHIPKTAGTSIRNALKTIPGSRAFKGADPESKPTKHSSLQLARERDGRLSAEFEKYRCISFVRNPWDRFVSLYAYLRERAQAEWQEDLASFESFTRAVLEKRAWTVRLASLRSQESYLMDQKGQLLVTAWGHFECLAEDFARITADLGVGVSLPKQNSSRHADYREYYTAETMGLVGEYFAGDVRRFGYPFEGRAQR